MKSKFINWQEIAFWAYKDTDHCNKNLRSVAIECLKEVDFNQNILSRFPKVKLSWYNFCEKINLDSSLKEDLLSFNYNDCIQFFISSALKTMDVKVDEEFVDSELKAVLNSTKKPKLKACLDDMIQVQQYFNDNNNIDLTAVKLCHKMLQFTTKFETLAFLQSCYDKLEEELFYELPTELLSQMVGKPCKIRDLSEKPTPNIPHRKMIVSPSFVITTSNNFTSGKTILYGKSGNILTTVNGGGLITVIPTNSTLEQFLITTDVFTGECKLFSSTRRSLSLMGQFDIQKDDEIHWMDAYLTPKKEIKLVWGGTDSLRGKITWSHFTGLNIESLLNEKDLFFEISSEEEIFQDQDFSKHGNLLSLWSHTEEDQNLDGRCWKTIQTIVQNAKIELGLASEKNCISVWGHQVQYFEFYNDKILFKELGKIKQTHLLNLNNLFSGAVLYSHSR